LQAFEKDKIRLKTSGLGHGISLDVRSKFASDSMYGYVLYSTIDENVPSTEVSVALQGAHMGEAEGGM